MKVREGMLPQIKLDLVTSLVPSVNRKMDPDIQRTHSEHAKILLNMQVLQITAHKIYAYKCALCSSLKIMFSASAWRAGEKLDFLAFVF